MNSHVPQQFSARQIPSVTPVMHPVMEFLENPARRFLTHARHKGMQQRRTSRREQQSREPQGKPHVFEKIFIYAGRVSQENSGDHHILLFRISMKLGNVKRA